MSRSKSIVQVIREGTLTDFTITVRYTPDPRLDALIDEVFGHAGAHRNAATWAITRRSRINAFCIQARSRGHNIHSIDRRRPVNATGRRRARCTA